MAKQKYIEFASEEEFKKYLEVVIAATDFRLNDHLLHYAKQFFFDGYDTYEDYVKYGDAFVAVESADEGGGHAMLKL